jgi:hypothetical protein
MKSIVIGIPLVLASFMVDLLMIPSLLLKSENEFEHKYQLYEEKMTRD